MNTSLGAQILKELEMEAIATRKVLAGIPESTYAYKPHEKSLPMGYVTLIVAEIPKWIATMVNNDSLDFATFEHFKAETTADMVKHFDENMELARKALQSISDEDLEKPFNLMNNGQIVFTAPKKENISPSINHQVHHRGQLTVYMRLNNLPVPSTYGPSADDRGF